MDAPDELVEAVAQAMAGVDEWNDYPADPRGYWTLMAGIVLSVPALAEVIARDAKVRGIVADPYSNVASRLGTRSARYCDIAALYPEAGKADDSDIMPGSEFDGPVVL